MTKPIAPLFVLLAVVLSACGPTAEPREAVLSSGDVGRSTTAISADGSTAYFSWVERDSTGWNVWVSSWSRGETAPSDAVRVNATPGNAAAHDQAPPQVGVDLAGNVYVAWINRIDVDGRRFPANDLFLAVSTDMGRTFGPEQTINNDAGGPPTGHTFHNLTRLADGAMLVSWIDGRTREASRTMDAMAAASTDHAAAHSGSGSEIRVARVEHSGAVIRETAVLDASSCPCCRTNLTVAPSGRIFAAWRHEYPTGERDIVLAHSDDGGESFSEFRPVHRDHWNIDACPHTGPALAVTANGSLHAAWFTGAHEAPGIYHAVSSDGGLTFPDVTHVLQDEAVSQVALTVRPDASVLLLTEDRTRKGLSKWSVRRSAVAWAQLVQSGVLPSAASTNMLSAETWRQDGRIMARVEEWS